MVLHAMREGAKSGISKFILFGFMVMAVGGLVLMDVGGFFRGGVASGNVVTIGGDKLGINAFDRDVSRTLSRQGLDVDTAWQLGLIDQILNQQISTNLMTRAAHDTGLYVSDDTIAQQIAELVAPYVDSSTTPSQAFERVLMSQGISESEFVRSVRQEMTNNVLQSAIALSANVGTDAETRDLYQYAYEERTVKYFLLPHSTVDGLQEASDDVLRPFYESGKERYAVPETRRFTLAILTEDAVRDTLGVSEEELQATYEDQIDSFTVAAKRNLEQTILTDRTQAEAVAEAVKGGKAMKDAVNDATGNDDAYLGTASFVQDGLADDIADEAFSAEVGDVIGPVETALGWHVLVVKGINEPRTRPFAEVKEDLRSDIMRNRLSDQMFDMSAQIDDHFAGGGTLDALREQMNLTVENYGPVRDDGSTPNATDGFTQHVEDRDDILQTAFLLHEGEVSPVMELSDASYAVIRVDEVNPKTYESFEDVRDALAETWMQDQREVLNRMRAQDIIVQLDGGNQDLAAAAQDNNGSIKTVTLVRGKESEAPFNNATKAVIYDTPVNGFAMAPAEGGFIIGQITDSTLPDPDDAPEADLLALHQTATRSTQEEFLIMYLEELRKKYGVKINRTLLEQMYGPGREQAQATGF